MTEFMYHPAEDKDYKVEVLSKTEDGEFSVEIVDGATSESDFDEGQRVHSVVRDGGELKKFK